MGQQLNKTIKRSRRAAYLKRKKERIKAAKKKYARVSDHRTPRPRNIGAVLLFALPSVRSPAFPPARGLNDRRRQPG